ncbi:sulfite exporter TauE/SafE family protein [Streptomyces sp. NBC_01317]|uniref:HoxN/HupN/NixA family nickel/cobalt transporter n=1 Tax=Streptomyces sp. NBC_01317 TaxID=2903822 RepID=UPI002E12D77D|nr:sulfite exporter TauE/SafE family protein [Streptomyces sp. NBC_01317]
MNLSTRRRLVAVPLTAALLTPFALLAAAPPAAAHPLGNFTVNYATHFTLRPHAVEAEIVVDRAEIAAAQERPLIDRDHDGSLGADERGAYADKACATLAGQLAADVGGVRIRWNRGAGGLTFRTGEAGLRTSRLTCRLDADAPLSSPADIRVVTHYDTRRIGWREITADGEGVTLTASSVPAVSATDRLRHYPRNPLAAPLDQRGAELRTAPGQGPTAGPGARIVPSGVPGAGVVTALLDKVSDRFDALIGSRELTLPVGLLALLLAVVLGASHAAMPGHGKTIMAAYLAGRRGTPRDAVTVGATVTLTHTAGVLALGLALPLATHLAGEAVLAWLGVVSGLLVTAIGCQLLRSAVRGDQREHHHGHGQGHGHGHGHHHPHGEHGHSHHPLPVLPPSRHTPTSGTTVVLTKPATALQHDHDHDHHHHSPTPSRGRRWSLVGVGIAGGLVPSPSALVVLLGAVALGRTAFGVLLVIGYGLGMAATLTLAGLLLVHLRDRIGTRTAQRASARLKALARIGPAATSALVLLVGIGLTARAVTGM